MPGFGYRLIKHMAFITPFLGAFKGMASFIAGREAVRETTQMIHTLKIALIGLAVVLVVWTIALLIIAAYALTMLIQAFQA
jgi:hypothetical protein